MGNRFKRDYPLQENSSWMDHAACANIENPDIFFPNFDNISDKSRRKAIEFAQQYCVVCPVRIACERYSEQFANGWGIWGEYVYDRSDRRNTA